MSSNRITNTQPKLRTNAPKIAKQNQMNKLTFLIYFGDNSSLAVSRNAGPLRVLVSSISKCNTENEGKLYSGVHTKGDNATTRDSYQESPRQTKPKKGQFMNFSQGHSGIKIRCVNRACFPKEKHQNSQKWENSMNFSFWPFLWFGLPGRLLILEGFLEGSLQVSAS